MDAIEFDELERLKAKIKVLKGSLTRNLLRAIAFRVEEVYPEATRAHIVLYPDNVYRVWALSAGKKWLAVCENDVAPTWTSMNLDRDIDLIVRLGWSPRIRTYTRTDGVEVHSLALRTWDAEKERRDVGDWRTRRVGQVQVPGPQEQRPVQGGHQRDIIEEA